jgi:hypothetical protein
VSIFSFAELHRLLCSADEIPPESEGVCIVDYALNDGPRCDNTALLAAPVAIVEETKHFWISDCIAGRYNAIETAYQIHKFVGRHRPARTLIERLSGWQYLQLEIIRQAEKYGTDLSPMIFFKPSKKPDAKRDRILLFKTACDEGRVHFVRGGWNEMLFKSLYDYTGEKRNKGRKDDPADVCGYLAQFG